MTANQPDTSQCGFISEGNNNKFDKQPNPNNLRIDSSFISNIISGDIQYDYINKVTSYEQLVGLTNNTQSQSDALHQIIYFPSGKDTDSIPDDNDMPMSGFNDVRKPYKDLGTDFLNQFVFHNDEIKGLFIYYFYTNMMYLIGEYIDKFNSTNKYILRGIKLNYSDIFLIFKGGNNMRIVVNNIIDRLITYFDYNKMMSTDQCNQMNKLLNTFRQILDENVSCSFYAKSFFGKSDCDFSIYINPIVPNMTEPIFNEIQNHINKLSLVFLIYYKKILSDTQFFGLFDVNNAANASLMTSLIQKIYFNPEAPITYAKDGMELPLRYIDVGQTRFSFDGTQVMTQPTMIKSKPSFAFIGKAELIDNLIDRGLIDVNTFKPDDRFNLNGAYYIPSNTIVTSQYYNFVLEENQYYVSLNRSLNLIYAGRSFHFDLMRIKYNIKLTFGEGANETSFNSPGEVIDLTTLYYGYNDLDKFFKHLDWSLTNYDYKLPNGVIFNYKLYSMNYLIKDLSNVLFLNNFNMWEDPKYQKRINRLMFFIFLRMESNYMFKCTDTTLISSYVNQISVSNRSEITVAAQMIALLSTGLEEFNKLIPDQAAMINYYDSFRKAFNMGFTFDESEPDITTTFGSILYHLCKKTLYYMCTQIHLINSSSMPYDMIQLYTKLDAQRMGFDEAPYNSTTINEFGVKLNEALEFVYNGLLIMNQMNNSFYHLMVNKIRTDPVPADLIQIDNAYMTHRQTKWGGATKHRLY